MTLDSAIITKDYGNPSIVRPRPINLQLSADGSTTQESQTTEDKKKSQVAGGVFMLLGFGMVAFVVYNILKTIE